MKKAKLIGMLVNHIVEAAGRGHRGGKDWLERLSLSELAAVMERPARKRRRRRKAKPADVPKRKPGRPRQTPAVA